MKQKPRQWLLDKIGAICPNQRMSWHATSPTHHIFFWNKHRHHNNNNKINIDTQSLKTHSAIIQSSKNEKGNRRGEIEWVRVIDFIVLLI